MIDEWMYVFVREDFPIEEQLVSVGHVTFNAGMREGDLGMMDVEDRDVPILVLIGVPNEKSLNRIRVKLKLHNIQSYEWIDEDLSKDVRAIATTPLSESQKEVLASYRLYKHKPD